MASLPSLLVPGHYITDILPSGLISHEEWGRVIAGALAALTNNPHAWRVSVRQASMMFHLEQTDHNIWTLCGTDIPAEA